MSDHHEALTETQRLTIRNTILSTLIVLDQRDAALATALSHALAPRVADLLATERQRGRDEVRAAVEGLADEWESRATNARECAEARIGLGDADALRAHGDLTQRRADELRAALAVPAAADRERGEGA